MFQIIKNLIIVLIIGFYVAYAWPAPGRYMEVISVQVYSETSRSSRISSGESVLLDVNRIIKQDFQGEYFVDVQRYDTDLNRWTYYCRGKGDTLYQTSAILPIPGPDPVRDLNLSWWIGKTEEDDCDAGYIIKTGTYRIITSWKIIRPMAFPIWVKNQSNSFIVE